MVNVIKVLGRLLKLATDIWPKYFLVGDIWTVEGRGLLNFAKYYLSDGSHHKRLVIFDIPTSKMLCACIV